MACRSRAFRSIWRRRRLRETRTVEVAFLEALRTITTSAFFLISTTLLLLGSRSILCMDWERR